MYPHLIRIILAILLSQYSLAQTFYGQHEVAVSYGYLPLQQRINSNLFGIYGGSRGMFLREASGMAMLSYRYYLGGCSSLGLSVGKNTFTTEYNDNGRIFSRSAFKCTTVAVEGTFNYRNRKYFRGYGYFGAGISFLHERKTEYTYTRNNYYNEQTNNFDFQFVPFGMSIGGKLAAFIELGIGYKGFINGGLSYRFDVRRTLTGSAPEHDKRAVVVYGERDVKEGGKHIGSVKTHKPKYDRDLSLPHQIERLAATAANDSANVVMITKVLRWHCNNCYWLRGEAWSVPQPDSFRAKVAEQERAEYGDGKYAYIIVYRKDANGAHNEHSCYLRIDSSGTFEIKNNTKYIFRISHMGWTPIIVPGLKPYRSYVKLEYGKKYYYRGSVQLHGFKSKLSIKKVTELSGEIESNNHTAVLTSDLK